MSVGEMSIWEMTYYRYSQFVFGGINRKFHKNVKITKQDSSDLINGWKS